MHKTRGTSPVGPMGTKGYKRRDDSDNTASSGESCVPGTTLGTRHTPAHLLFTQPNETGIAFFSPFYFTEKEQAQRGKVIYPKSHSQKVTNPGWPDSQGHVLSQLFIYTQRELVANG